MATSMTASNAPFRGRCAMAETRTRTLVGKNLAVFKSIEGGL